MSFFQSSASRPDLASLGNFGWKYYSQIRGKAMEQEFSWSGLTLSLSIAFFVVVATAQGLSIALHSINKNKQADPASDKVYYLESAMRPNDGRLT